MRHLTRPAIHWRHWWCNCWCVTDDVIACVQETPMSTELRRRWPAHISLLPVLHVTWSAPTTPVRHLPLRDTMTDTQCLDWTMRMMRRRMWWRRLVAVTMTTLTMIQRETTMTRRHVLMTQFMTSGRRRHTVDLLRLTSTTRTVALTTVALVTTSVRGVTWIMSRTFQGRCRRRPVWGRCLQQDLGEAPSSGDDLFTRRLHLRRHLHLHPLLLLLQDDVISLTLTGRVPRRRLRPFTHQRLRCCRSTVSSPPLCSALRMSFYHFRFRIHARRHCTDVVSASSRRPGLSLVLSWQINGVCSWLRSCTLKEIASQLRAFLFDWFSV